MATFAPHVERAVNEINDRFPALGKGGTYPGHGEDGSQYAADFWSTNKGVHDVVFYWLIANHKRLGLKYVISWERIWSDARSDEGVRRYRRDANSDGTLSASERHTNHVHTSWNVNPPPRPTPPPPPPEEEDMPTSQEIVNAFLNAKITSGDPAFNGWTVNHILDWTARNSRANSRATAAVAANQKVAQADLDDIQATLAELDDAAPAPVADPVEPGNPV